MWVGAFLKLQAWSPATIQTTLLSRSKRIQPRARLDLTGALGCHCLGSPKGKLRATSCKPVEVAHWARVLTRFPKPFVEKVFDISYS